MELVVVLVMLKDIEFDDVALKAVVSFGHA